MELTSALGTCAKCGMDKLQVDGIQKCVFCERENTQGSGLVVDIDDPGEDAIKQILSKVGVAEVVGGKPPVPIKPDVKPIINVSPKVQVVPQGSGIEQALAILRSLPMPKDIKQFKSINKAIKILETLGA